jgi:hypothetical protein
MLLGEKLNDISFHLLLLSSREGYLGKDSHQPLLYKLWGGLDAVSLVSPIQYLLSHLLLAGLPWSSPFSLVLSAWR